MQQGDQFNLEFAVTADVYEGFIQLFKDQNPLHTDTAFAQNKGFAGRVMHGNILNGFISYFIGECLPTKDVIIHLQEIKYILPVYLGQTLGFTAEIAGFYESVNAYEFKFTFTNPDGKKVAKGKVQIGII